MAQRSLQRPERFLQRCHGGPIVSTPPTTSVYPFIQRSTRTSGTASFGQLLQTGICCDPRHTTELASTKITKSQAIGMVGCVAHDFAKLSEMVFLARSAPSSTPQGHLATKLRRPDQHAPIQCRPAFAPLNPSGETLSRGPRDPPLLARNAPEQCHLRLMAAAPCELIGQRQIRRSIVPHRPALPWLYKILDVTARKVLLDLGCQ
jgi:hypothetical protein